VRRRSTRPRAGPSSHDEPRVRDDVRYEISGADPPSHDLDEPVPAVPLRRPARLLRLPDVMDRVGLRRAAIYKLVSDGRFPEPVRIGARAVAWVESEVQEWIERRIHARHSPTAAPGSPSSR